MGSRAEVSLSLCVADRTTSGVMSLEIGLVFIWGFYYG